MAARKNMNPLELMMLSTARSMVEDADETFDTSGTGEKNELGPRQARLANLTPGQLVGQLQAMVVAWGLETNPSVKAFHELLVNFNWEDLYFILGGGTLEAQRRVNASRGKLRSSEKAGCTPLPANLHTHCMTRIRNVYRLFGGLKANEDLPRGSKGTVFPFAKLKEWFPQASLYLMAWLGSAQHCELVYSFAHIGI